MVRQTKPSFNKPPRPNIDKPLTNMPQIGGGMPKPNIDLLHMKLPNIHQTKPAYNKGQGKLNALQRRLGS